MPTEPVEYRNEYVETAAGVPPPPAAYPAAAPVVAPVAGQRAYASSATAVPAGFRGRQLVWVAIAIVDIILALDFIFYIAGANDTGFAHAIYVMGGALAAPFRGIFATTLTPGNHPVIWTDLLAIVVYSIAAWIVDRIVLIASTPSSRRGVTAPY